MTDITVTQNDLTQVMSKTLVDLAMGRNINKSRMEKQIEISDALNRRMQTKINTMRAMIEAKRAGLDFSAAMKEINEMVKETGESLSISGLDE